MNETKQIEGWSRALASGIVHWVIEIKFHKTGKMFNGNKHIYVRMYIYIYIENVYIQAYVYRNQHIPL